MGTVVDGSGVDVRLAHVNAPFDICLQAQCPLHAACMPRRLHAAQCARRMAPSRVSGAVQAAGGNNSRKKPDCRAGKHAVWLAGLLVDLKDARSMMIRIMMILGDVSVDG